MTGTPAWVVATVLAPLLLWAPPGAAQPGEDLKTLRQEVDALKSGQAAIHRELRNIRRLLRAGPAGQTPPQDLVLDLGGTPVKGAPTASVTLVELTDYQ
jgi:hypothetical protein